MRYHFYIVAFLFLLALQLPGQTSEDATKAYNQGRYKEAIKLYNKSSGISADKSLLYERGSAYFFVNKLTHAIADFTLAKKLGNDSPDLFLKMAQAKQHLSEYNEAAFFYKEYLKSSKKESGGTRLAQTELKNCAYGALNKSSQSDVAMQNFGAHVNTEYDELYVTQSPRYGNVYYFSSNRNLIDFDVYATSFNMNGKWEMKKDFGNELNSRAHDYIMDVSADGQCLLFMRKDINSNVSRTYISTFDDTGKERRIEFKFDGAVDLQIVDRNTIAFASDRLKGYGGYDLFTISYSNEKWTAPVNEGPGVNTEYDERSPFLSPDSQNLYFSSNRPYNFGGFDIYYYNKKSIEGKVKNMGKPINSAGNDLNFRMNDDALIGMMASDRKTGEGGYDIYMAHLQNIKPFPPKDKESIEYVQDYLKTNKEVTAAERAEVKRNVVKNEATEPTKTKRKTPIKVETKNPQQKETEQVVTTQKPTPIPTKTNKVKEEPLIVTTVKKNKSTSEKEVIPTKTNTSPRKTKASEINVQKSSPKEKVVSAESSAASSATKKYNDNVPTEPIVEITNPNKVGEIIIDHESFPYTLFYGDSRDLQNKVNSSKVDNLITYLSDNKEHTAKLIAYSGYNEPGLPEFVQYNTLKRAAVIARYFLNNNISRNRISIESVANNYPIAKESIAGEANPYEVYNSRIDIQLINKDGEEVDLSSSQEIELPAYARDRRYALYQLMTEDVYYSIEIANSENIFKNAVLRLYQDIYIRKPNALSNNYYNIGIYSKYEEAFALQKKLEKTSAPYAKVVAFKQGKILKEKEAQLLYNDFPDLKRFFETK